MKLSKRIIRLLETGRIVVDIKYLESGIWGYCIKDEHRVEISVRLCMKSRVRTLVHEVLHYIFPRNTEKQTLRLEDEVYNSLTPLEHKRLARSVRIL